MISWSHLKVEYIFLCLETSFLILFNHFLKPKTSQRWYQGKTLVFQFVLFITGSTLCLVSDSIRFVCLASILKLQIYSSLTVVSKDILCYCCMESTLHNNWLWKQISNLVTAIKEIFLRFHEVPPSLIHKYSDRSLK